MSASLHAEVVSLDEYVDRQVARYETMRWSPLPPLTGLPLEPLRVRRARAEEQRKQDDARKREGSER